jgi:adenosylcobinamide amidohydrolase
MQFVTIDAIQRKAAMVAAIQAAIIAKMKLEHTRGLGCEILGVQTDTVDVAHYNLESIQMAALSG